MGLDGCTSGQRYRVRNVKASGKLFYKLLDMGFIDGATIEVIREAPLYDPMELRIHNYLVTLRKSEAKLIEVENI